MTSKTSGAGQESGVIQSVSRETRLFPPPADFVAKARIKDPAEYQRLYNRSIQDPDGFWGDMGKSELAWTKPFSKVRSGQLPWVKWFEDGELNLSANCLDRHLATRGDKPAIIFEGEPGDERVLTFKQLHAEVCQFAGGPAQPGGRHAAIGSRCTCRWCPRLPLPCWPAPASGHRTR